MTNGSKQWLVRGGSFVFATLLLYFALRGVEFEQVKVALAHANYWWLIPIIVVTLASHWLRTLRWVIFLEESPRKAGLVDNVNSTDPRPISTFNAFISVMVGYMANYAGPRLGEVIRTGNVARREHMHFSTVFGTVVAERTLDMVTFAIFLLSVPLIFSDQIADLASLLFSPIQSWLDVQSPVLIVLASVAVVLIAIGVLVFLVRGIRNTSSKLGALFSQFRIGFLTLFSAPSPWVIVFQTCAMWLCYGLMAYLPLVLLGQHSVYDIDFIHAWGIMLIGAIGVIIPSPGGIGTYHFITIQSLALLFAMPSSEAATYALLTHTGQMLLYVVIGFSAMLFWGATFSFGTEAADPK